VDYVIGADGANSRVAKAIDAGEYNYAIAFQERIKVHTISHLYVWVGGRAPNLLHISFFYQKTPVHNLFYFYFYPNFFPTRLY
jgi:flavin-dependent dehydrogenase